VVGRASPLLSLRAGAFAALLAGLLVYYATSESLWSASTWWDVAFLSFVLMPAVFGLVYLVLPLRTWRGLLPLAFACGVLAVVLSRAHLDIAANFVKLAAVTALAFWFLGYFETVAWIVIVAAIIPWVDAYSVWRGPTHHIVSQQPEIFTALSIAFPIPGEHASANLGLPDVLFFGLFLAASARFQLRPAWTWLAMTLSFGATIALAVWLDLSGLPALPGLSIGFLLANADLLWRRLREPRVAT
jgi:hypothetical protein